MVSGVGVCICQVCRNIWRCRSWSLQEVALTLAATVQSNRVCGSWISCPCNYFIKSFSIVKPNKIDPRKYRINSKDLCSSVSWPPSCRGKPLGYNIDDTKLKRAGLDYWPYVVVKVHDTWDEFRDYFMQQDGDKRLLAFTKRGTNIHSDFSYKPGDWLVFGSETKGLPESALEDCSGEALGGGTIRIPMVETYVRCLNLSVSVGVALYEAARQLNYEQLQYQPDLPEEAQGLFPAEDIYG